MVTSSTEYAITKRGMSPPLRKRDKPLRTYGKRVQTTTAESIEPPAKKRRVSAVSISGNATVHLSKLAASTLTQATVEARETSMESGKPQESARPGGSILSYFQRVEKQAREPEVEAPEEKEVQSSSPPRPTRRKPRILRLRATLDASSHVATSEDLDVELQSPTKSKQSSREPLEECTAATNNARTTEARFSKKKDAPAVQTTLNISPQAAFSECKVCDTVWNPLYPDDVKYHQKRHAAVLKKKKARREAEL